jgi:hypothetical protein
MSTPEDRRLLQRFVAGIDVEADELATAITAQALEQTIVDQAVLDALSAEEAIVRLRAARRVGRMATAAPSVLARLRVLAEHDGDSRVREAAAAALGAHTPRTAPDPAAAARLRPFLARVELVLAGALRGADGYEFRPSIRHGMVGLGGKLVEAGDEAELRLRGLPAPFVGTRPVLIADGAERGRAADAVSEAGEASVRVTLGERTLSELSEELRRAELVVLDD